MRAGMLFDRLTFYRNDMTPTADTDPHGFMADPTLAGRSGAEQEIQPGCAEGRRAARGLGRLSPGRASQFHLARGLNVKLERSVRLS